MPITSVKRRDHLEWARDTVSKYNSPPLFDYTSAGLDACCARLRKQAVYHKMAPKKRKRYMEVRGLLTAAFTLNATAIWTAKLLARGAFSMRTQRLIFKKRWRQSPKEWGANAKSCFARALCGYSIGSDSVCIDRHLERMGSVPPDAEGQWREWFRLYESMYGPGEMIACADWHVRVLDWIALRIPRPMAWK